MLFCISAYPQPGPVVFVTPTSATSLASPSLLAVRLGYQEHGLKTVFQANVRLTYHGTRSVSNLPQWHCVLYPSGLVVRMGDTAFSSMRVPRTTIHKMKRRSFAEGSRDIMLKGINCSNLARLGSVVTRRYLVLRSNGPPAIIGKFSFEDTTESTS